MGLFVPRLLSALWCCKFGNKSHHPRSTLGLFHTLIIPAKWICKPPDLAPNQKNPECAFNTRICGIFKKALYLVKLVNNANIAVYIERDGQQFYFETAPDLLPISKKKGVIHIKQEDIEENNPRYSLVFLSSGPDSDFESTNQNFAPLPGSPPAMFPTLLGNLKRDRDSTPLESAKRVKNSWIKWLKIAWIADGSTVLLSGFILWVSFFFRLCKPVCNIYPLVLA